MSVTAALRENTNWHTLHCDHDSGCRASFTVDYLYHSLNHLREIATQDAGWTMTGAGKRARDEHDFCFRHSVAHFQRR